MNRHLRRTLKAVWWILTPWQLPQRYAHRRKHARVLTRTANLQSLLAQERRRDTPDDVTALPTPTLDLFDDAALMSALGKDFAAARWAPVAAADVRDSWSAARWCVDLWRTQARGFDARRFVNHARDQLHLLDGEGRRHAQACLEGALARSARQAFLCHPVVSQALPHGLTPAGMGLLFPWLVRDGREELGLRIEQIWWLCLEAAGQPGQELVLAWSFCPEWQRRHPAGLTVFGCDAFSRWFASRYGAQGAWLNPQHWLEAGSPAQQLRTAYWAFPSWRQLHPQAMDDAAHAQALLAWLRSPAAALAERAAAWIAAQDPTALASELGRDGANVIGHFCYPSGLRVSAESLTQGMLKAGLGVSLRDVWADARDEPNHAEFRGAECYPVTIVHVQPTPFFDAAYHRAHLAERVPRSYRIGYWYWEFDTMPEDWRAQAAQVEEVWTATEFIAKGLREKLSIPVRTMFPGVRLAPYELRPKSHFGLDPLAFTFLFTFHMVSVMERKNPGGLVRAFRHAFGEDSGVQLALKTSFGDRHPQQLQSLRRTIGEARNIVLIDDVYSPDEVLSLMGACDAYVSLHRSEGLGLTIAEAMLMGKPAIATGFSGNMDFMDCTNSLPVDYTLVPLGVDIPPYDASFHWAEPSEEHAAQLMRRVYDNQAWARELGARAKASAEANLSLEAAGRRIAARLEEIRKLRRRQQQQQAG